jgi:hypothetical protein
LRRLTPAVTQARRQHTTYDLVHGLRILSQAQLIAGLREHSSKVARAMSELILGSVMLAAGRPGEAIAPLEDAVRLHTEKQLVMSPDHTDAVVALAQARTRESTTASIATYEPDY